jgi:hypothetical protein
MTGDWSKPNTDIISDLEHGHRIIKESGKLRNEFRFLSEEHRNSFIRCFCYLCADEHPEKCPYKTCSFYEHNPYIEKVDQ